ncbi:MAG: ATP-dependent RNA helicase HrpA, partial [Porticoccaceae bacterium]|nr:ATP-dependent RNA helicase HrpA [Porticoccaceae bacterium]
FRHDHQEFIGARDRKFVVFPGSGLARKPPKWLVAAELIETSRLFAHQVASIDPDWLPDLAAHLVRKSHSEPHYDPRRGQVMAYEKQTLFGLTIVDRKRVGYSGIDPVQAREVFIRGALVENRYRGDGAFARHNAGLIQELQELEDRLRRRDIVIDDGAIFDFYDARIPSDITNLRAFERWRRKAEGENPRLLFLDRTLLVDRTAVGEAEEQFPKALDWGDTEYTLSYRFEPGHASDGVTVHIPAPQVHQVPDYRFQWLVPGLLRDKCIALVKGLPKQLRKQFVPVPNFVDRALQTMVPDNKPLGPTLGDHLKKHTAIAIPADAWDESAVDDFYRITYCLDDEKGRAIDQDKDLEALKNRHRATVRSAIKSGRGDVRERKGIDRWDFGTLQANTRVRKGKLEIDVFPGLVDEGDSVRLKLFDNPQEAEVESVRGVARLMRLHYPDPARYLRKQLLKGSELPLVAAGFGDPSVLREDIIDAAYQQACLGLNPLPRSEADFLERLQAGKPHVVGKAQEIERLIMSVLTPLKQLRDAAKRLEERYPEAIADVRAQLDELFCPGFLFAWNEEWLAQYPRYIQAALMRLEKLPGQVEKDRQCLMEIQELRHRWQSLWDRSPTGSNAFRREMETARFMFEEYRVSVFAQVLKTRLPVSPKRIRQQLEKAEKLLSTV